MCCARTVIQYATSCKLGLKFIREVPGIRLERVDVRLAAVKALDDRAS